MLLELSVVVVRYGIYFFDDIDNSKDIQFGCVLFNVDLSESFEIVEFVFFGGQVDFEGCF